MNIGIGYKLEIKFMPRRLYSLGSDPPWQEEKVSPDAKNRTQVVQSLFYSVCLISYAGSLKYSNELSDM